MAVETFTIEVDGDSQELELPDPASLDPPSADDPNDPDPELANDGDPYGDPDAGED
tara:strand:+ start:11173 stop:11340 length:168 start_codon:yes stop_codon:yes gene_type:complete